MDLKTCSKCGVDKGLEYFCKSKNGKGGFCSQCKSCFAEYKKRYKEEIGVKSLEYRKRNKVVIVEINRAYYQKHKQEIGEKQREYRKGIRSKTAKYHRERYQNDDGVRLLKNLRRRLTKFLNTFSKSASTKELLGCPIDWLWLHLESKFYDGEDGLKMTRENYGIGGWQIDHIVPCSSFDLSDPKQQRQCFHWTNLQPLWAKDNLSKNDNLDWQHPCPTINSDVRKGKMVFLIRFFNQLKQRDKDRELTKNHSYG